MKKYIGKYMILFVILLIMFITGGIPYGNTVKEIELGWMDTGKTTVILLTYNLIITIIVLVAGIMISCKKDNKTPLKWLFPIGMLAFIFTLVPIIKEVSIGGRFVVETTYFYSLAKYFI